MERLRDFVQKRKRRVRVGLAGEGRLMELIARSYKKHPRAIMQAVYHPDLDRARDQARRWGCTAFYNEYDTFLSDVELVEFGEIPGGHYDLSIRAIESAKHVSIPMPSPTGRAYLMDLARQANRVGVRARVNDPFLFYPPYVVVKGLLDKQEIGEPCSLRIKVTIGKGGAWPLPDVGHASGPEAFFSHPCLDRCSLAVYLFGTVERVAAYLNSGDLQRGGQGLIILKFSKPGRFGALDLTYAPEMHIRSDYYPIHEVVEIAGSDGIIWVNHCIGKMTQEPPIMVRRARSYYQIGVESGIASDFADAWDASASNFVCSLLKKTMPRSAVGSSIHRLDVLMAAIESIHSKKECIVALK